MGKLKQRVILLITVCFALAAMIFAVVPLKISARADGEQNAINENLVVRYAMDDTSTGNGAKLAAQKWDVATQSFVDNASAAATVQNHVNNGSVGTVSSVSGGVEGSALKFTGKAHARADFRLPEGATGMTVTMWVKDINTYWASLIEFWDGSNGGRFGKGTMQGNGGRSNEADPWSSNCPAHNSATIADGGGWDSFVIKHNNTNNDNGGAAVDPMVAGKWYHIAFVITSTEMKAYRNGDLKQTFDKGNSASIAQSIMTAVTNEKGKLGIRLSHDANDGDVLDDLRIYSVAMTGTQVKEELYSNPNPIATIMTTVPEYYDVEGLGYPEILLDGATSVTEGANGKKTGVTARGVTYSYTPVSGDATPAKDNTNVKITCSKEGYEYEATIKYRRKLNLRAQGLAYKIGNNGASVPVTVPEHAGEDIIVKVSADTDLANVKAGDIAAEQLTGDSNTAHYTTQFLYSASTATAKVRISYTPYSMLDTIYTIKFVKKSTDTFTDMKVTGGTESLNLTKEDFTGNSANVAVSDLQNFTLNVSLTLVEGAATENGSNTKTFTQSDLQGGKLAVQVTNENGDTVVYYLVPVLCSADATLSALSAGSYGLNFEAGKTEYTVTVNKSEIIDLLDAVTYTVNDTRATAKKIYNVTDGAIVVIVTAEDGTIARYIVNVNVRQNGLPDGRVGQDSPEAASSAKSGGWNSSVGGTAIWACTFLLLAAVWAIAKKCRKGE